MLKYILYFHFECARGQNSGVELTFGDSYLSMYYEERDRVFGVVFIHSRDPSQAPDQL